MYNLNLYLLKYFYGKGLKGNPIEMQLCRTKPLIMFILLSSSLLSVKPLLLLLIFKRIWTFPTFSKSSSAILTVLISYPYLLYLIRFHILSNHTYLFISFLTPFYSNYPMYTKISLFVYLYVSYLDSCKKIFYFVFGIRIIFSKCIQNTY